MKEQNNKKPKKFDFCVQCSDSELGPDAVLAQTHTYMLLTLLL
jgi:hypothetical protein